MKRRLLSIDGLAPERDGYSNVFLRKSEAKGCKNEKRYKCKRKKSEKERQKGRMKRRVDKEVLRVSDGCDHAADIGSNCLKDNYSWKITLLIRNAENKNGERDKSQQRDVVCHNHGGEKRKGNKKKADLSESRYFRKKKVCAP